MNFNDLITISYHIKYLDDNREIDKRSNVVGYAYMKNFFDCYLAHLGLSDIEISETYNKPWMNRKSTIDGVDLEWFDDDEIINL